MNLNPLSPPAYEYLHYTSEDIETLDLNRKYYQSPKNLACHSPNGLWLSITGKNDWIEYCLRNSLYIDNVKSEFQVFLKPHAKILILNNTATLENFAKEYGYYSENKKDDLVFRWDKVIKNYQGIALPTLKISKLPNMATWHKVWCCTSACIWDLQAVEKVGKLV